MSKTLTLAARGIQLSSSNGTAPSEFRIWAFGDVETTKGTFKLTPDSAALVMAAAADWGNQYSLDYNHAIPNGEISPEGAIAAAWYDLELRDDGVWAANVSWTQRALDYLLAKEYRYFSPWFMVDETGHIVEYMNAALTNLPATKEMQALIASRGGAVNSTRDRRDKGVALSIPLDRIYTQLDQQINSLFPGAYLCEVFNDYAVFQVQSRLFRITYTVNETSVALIGDAVEVEKTYLEIQGGATMKTVLLALALGETANEAQALERVTSLTGMQRELLSITGESEAQKALGIIAGWKAGHANAVTLAAKLEQVDSERKQEKLLSLIATGKSDGKLTPAMEPWALTQSSDALEAFLSVAPKAINITESKEPAPAGSSGGSVLLTHNGKDWKALTPIEKAGLYQSNLEQYSAMKTQAQELGLTRLQ